MSRDRLPPVTLALCVCGTVALLPTAGGRTGLLLTAAAMLVVWSVVERRTDVRLPAAIARAADVLIVTSIVGLSVTHFGFESTSLATLGPVLAVAQLSRAFRRKSSRDLMVMNGTAVGQAGLAAFLTRDPVYLPILLVVVVLGVLSALRVAAAGLPEGPNVRIFTARPRGSAGLRARMGFVAQPALLSLGIVAIGVLFFVILPRGRRFLEQEERRRETDPAASEELRAGSASTTRGASITGFSDRVSLGDVGRIKEVLREAFSVRITEGRRTVRANGPLYFRGAVFDTFDGRRWHRNASPPGGERWLTTERLPAEIPLAKAERRAGTRLIRQRFRLKETFARALPCLGTVTSVRLHEGLPRVLAVAGGTYLAPDVPGAVLSYEMSSLVSFVENRPATEADLTPAERARHLALPEGTTRLSALAVEVAGKGHPLDRAARLARWLGENCDYTLSFRPWPSGRPVHDFLFVTKAGHCEYFATALAMMLRATGTPSRLVAGYRGGLWIEGREEYYLRLNDAHAWVEAYVTGRGWVRLDPTPPDGNAVSVGASRVPGRAAESLTPGIASRIATLFTEFGPEERSEALSGGVRAIDFMVREGFGPGRPHRPFPPPLLALAVAAAVTLLLHRVVLSVRRTGPGGPASQRAGPTPSTEPVDFYEAALRVLGRHGHRRRRDQSPREFLDSVRERRGEAIRPFVSITKTFEGAR
ncbi:MAG: DUF3488 and transglutaminase-like domain-containing protein, partial [Planctomycetota bacterium]